MQREMRKWKKRQVELRCNRGKDRDKSRKHQQKFSEEVVMTATKRREIAIGATAVLILPERH